MDINLDTNNIAVLQRRLRRSEKAANVALRRSLNKVAQQAKTHVIRQTGRELALPQKKIRERVTIQKARNDNLEAVVRVSRQAVRLFEYKPRQLRRGISIRVKKTGGRKVLRHAFIAAMRSGHTGVFTRAPGVARLPIRELFGPAVIEVARDHIESATEKAQDKLPEVFEHEFGYANRDRG